MIEFLRATRANSQNSFWLELPEDENTVKDVCDALRDFENYVLDEEKKLVLGDIRYHIESNGYILNVNRDGDRCYIIIWFNNFVFYRYVRQHVNFTYNYLVLNNDNNSISLYMSNKDIDFVFESIKERIDRQYQLFMKSEY